MAVRAFLDSNVQTAAWFCYAAPSSNEVGPLGPLNFSQRLGKKKLFDRKISCRYVTAAEYRLLRVRDHWAAAGEEALAAARACATDERWRSVVSRSYFAAYSFAASVLAKEGVAFREDRVGPEHEPLPDLIRDQLGKRFGQPTLKELRATITALYAARITADYKPHQIIDKSSALHAERLATTVRKLMSKELP